MDLTKIAEGMKTIRRPRKIDREIVNLTVAWLTDHISIAQASKAIEMKTKRKHGVATYIDFARSIKQLYREGKITIKP